MRTKKCLRTKMLSDIKERIISEDLKPGATLPTALELAATYNVSHITANRVMEILAKDGLIYRTKGSGSFVAKSDVSAKKYKIGIVIYIEEGDSISLNAAFGSFFKVAPDLLRAQGHQIEYIEFNDLSKTDSPETLLADYDAFIVSSSCIDPVTIVNLKKTKRPVVVMLQTEIMDCPFHQVLPFLSSGFKDVFELFKAKNHRKLTLIYSTANARFQSFINAAANAGWATDDIIMVPAQPVHGDLGRMSGYNAAKAIRDLKNGKAIFSTSDFLSLGVIDAFKERGLLAGEDFDLISFDDLESSGWCPFDEPFLTSISICRKKIAEHSVKLILDQLENPTEYSIIARFPTELAIRKSCNNNLV